MNRILCIFLILFATLRIAAQEFEVNGIKYSLLGEGKIQVIGSSKTGRLVIPKSVEYRGRTLIPTEIGERAFANSKIHSVKLPTTLKKINDQAFIYSTVSEINFPEGLYYIGESAFQGTELDSIFLPHTLCYHPRWRETGVAEFAFRDCKNLKVVEFGLSGYPSEGYNHMIDDHEKYEPIRVFSGAFDDCENIEIIIYQGEPPIFDPYINGCKSKTFPTTVLEFATLYCHNKYIGSGERFSLDIAMSGFANVKSIPKTWPSYTKLEDRENLQRLKVLRQVVDVHFMAAKYHGYFKYDKNGDFVCGKKHQIESLESTSDSTLTILLDKKKNIILHEQLDISLNLAKTQGRNSITSFDVLTNWNSNPMIYRCITTYSTNGESCTETNFCLWYDDKIYKIGAEFNNVLEQLFLYTKGQK